MKPIYFRQKSAHTDSYSEEIINAFKGFSEVVSFEQSQIDINLPWNYQKDEPYVLLIPSVFEAANTLNYDGVEFALQWYFYLVNENKEFSIILLGSESKAAFFEHCDYSFFIKCPNVHYVEFSIDEIKQSVAYIQPKLFEKEQYIKSLKNIGIKAPTSYKTHHSVANEWSIYRWSKYLGIENNTQEALDNEIKKSLYYNYLQTIYPIKETDNQKYKILEKGNLLLIDDEEDKGWNDFFKEIITSNQKFYAIGKSFKKLTTQQIIETAEKKVNDFNPHVVILDLRLHDDDFDKKPTEELTGIKILDRIKAINYGIQVLAFTASNKIWNYQKLQHMGIDGFILKESPELSQENKFTVKAIKGLRNNIEGALKRKYLKEMFFLLDKLSERIENRIKNKTLDKKFGKELIKLLKISYEMQYRAIHEEDFAFSYLALFKCLELISSEYVFNTTGNPFPTYQSHQRPTQCVGKASCFFRK
jgi:DNA-binding NarL/FixJ family response regulator